MHTRAARRRHGLLTLRRDFANIARTLPSVLESGMPMENRLLGPLELVRILDALREGIQIVDREWRYLYLNVAAASHGRRTRQELIGRRMQDCYPGIEATEVFALMRRGMNEGQADAMRNEFTYPDGAMRTFDIRVQPCDLGIVVLSIDVTEAVKLEAQLLHAQKMEAVGRLAGGVAHDFNNLLSVILGYSTLMLGRLESADPRRPDLEAVRLAGEKGAVLTRQLLALSRQQPVEARIVDLNEALGATEEMLRRLLGEDIELDVHYGRPLSNVKIDPGMLDQIVMNLAVNARDAMESGGRLTIATANVELDEAFGAAHLGVRPGGYVMLAVGDTGTGMDRETQARIFEPFYTTKELGRGTGLGLSTVFGIVQRLGGTIWVYSEPGVGSTFKVYLPQVPGETVLPIEAPPPATLRGTETILLVEDQDEVRQVARDILHHYGYNVIDAPGAAGAISLVETHAGPIHLLLTDLVMARVDGLELAGRVTAERPDTRVVYMSGHAGSSALQQRVLESGLAFLQKPILPDLLVRTVREALDSAPQSGRVRL